MYALSYNRDNAYSYTVTDYEFLNSIAGFDEEDFFDYSRFDGWLNADNREFKKFFLIYRAVRYDMQYITVILVKKEKISGRLVFLCQEAYEQIRKREIKQMKNRKRTYHNWMSAAAVLILIIAVPSVVYAAVVYFQKTAHRNADELTYEFTLNYGLVFLCLLKSNDIGVHTA